MPTLPPFSAPLGLHYPIKSVVRPKIFIQKSIDVHLENDFSEPEKSESESVAAQCFQRPDYGSIEQPHSHTLMIIYSRSLFF